MYKVLKPISKDGQSIPAGAVTELEWLNDRGVKQLVERGLVEAIDPDSEEALQAIAARDAEARRVGVGPEVSQDREISPENLGEGEGSDDDEDAEGDEQPGEMWKEASNVTQLRKYAKAHNVELATGDKKPEILTKLRAARGDFEERESTDNEQPTQTQQPDGTWVTSNPADRSTKTE